MTTTPPPVPSPLGFCATCISQSRRSPATTMLDGTALCDKCTITKIGGHNTAGALGELQRTDERNAEAGSVENNVH